MEDIGSSPLEGGRPPVEVPRDRMFESKAALEADGGDFAGVHQSTCCLLWFLFTLPRGGRTVARSIRRRRSDAWFPMKKKGAAGDADAPSRHRDRGDARVTGRLWPAPSSSPQPARRSQPAARRLALNTYLLFPLPPTSLHRPATAGCWLGAVWWLHRHEGALLSWSTSATPCTTPASRPALTKTA